MLRAPVRFPKFTKSRLGGLLSCVFLLLSVGCSARQNRPTPPAGVPPISPQGIAIQQLLEQVQEGLLRAQVRLVNMGMPPLDSVQLDLQATAVKSANGGVSLWVISFGKKWERDLSQEVMITLKPPKPSGPVRAAAEPTMADELADAIVSAAQGVQKASQSPELPLRVNALQVTLGFVVKGDTSAGGKFSIAPVTLDLEGQLSNQAVQKITVTFQKANH